MRAITQIWVLYAVYVKMANTSGSETWSKALKTDAKWKHREQLCIVNENVTHAPVCDASCEHQNIYDVQFLVWRVEHDLQFREYMINRKHKKDVKRYNSFAGSLLPHFSAYFRNFPFWTCRCNSTVRLPATAFPCNNFRILRIRREQGLTKLGIPFPKHPSI